MNPCPVCWDGLTPPKFSRTLTCYAVETPPRPGNKTWTKSAHSGPDVQCNYQPAFLTSTGDAVTYNRSTTKRPPTTKTCTNLPKCKWTCDASSGTCRSGLTGSFATQVSCDEGCALTYGQKFLLENSDGSKPRVCTVCSNCGKGLVVVTGDSTCADAEPNEYFVVPSNPATKGLPIRKSAMERIQAKLARGLVYLTDNYGPSGYAGDNGYLGVTENALAASLFRITPLGASSATSNFLPLGGGGTVTLTNVTPEGGDFDCPADLPYSDYKWWLKNDVYLVCDEPTLPAHQFQLKAYK